MLLASIPASTWHTVRPRRTVKARLLNAALKAGPSRTRPCFDAFL